MSLNEKLLNMQGNCLMEKQFKILIVDDSHALRSMLKNTLMHAGFVTFADFFEAEHGLNALNLLKRDTFHMVISDWDMPKMDGLELLKTMHADENLAKIPFIMVSSISDQDKVVEAIKAGVDHYITKPFKPDSLAHHVKDLLIARNGSAKPLP